MKGKICSSDSPLPHGYRRQRGGSQRIGTKLTNHPINTHVLDLNVLSRVTEHKRAVFNYNQTLTHYAATTKHILDSSTQNRIKSKEKIYNTTKEKA